MTVLAIIAIVSLTWVQWRIHVYRQRLADQDAGQFGHVEGRLYDEGGLGNGWKRRA